MTEFEIYLPTLGKDGEAIKVEAIETIKEKLKTAFGGYTHLNQANEGAWRMGGITFRDEITILRVLDDGTASFDMDRFKITLEEMLNQDSVLIVSREVRVL